MPRRAGRSPVDVSVWESVEALWDYVYRSGHLAVLNRRRDWFHRHAEAYQALWWVPAGHRPSAAEALERVGELRAKGSTPRAFTFREPHPAPVDQAA